MSRQPEPIFLLGLPRCGSTWASRALKAATGARLVHEPFNWERYPRRKTYHMRFVPAGEEQREMASILDQAMRRRGLWQSRRRQLVKDVHIGLAAEFLNEHYHPHILFMIRHPCAMALSWRSLNLEVGFRLELLLGQPKVVERFLGPFSDHMKPRDDFFFDFGAYWGAAYYIMQVISSEYSWGWISHEALCVESERRYLSLLARFGIPASPSGQRRLNRFVEQTNRRRAASEGPYSLARLSAAEPEKWRDKLSEEQIAAVIEGARPFGMLDQLERINQAFAEPE